MPRAVRRFATQGDGDILCRSRPPTAQAAWILRHLFRLFSERWGPRPRSSSSHRSGVRGKPVRRVTLHPGSADASGYGGPDPPPRLALDSRREGIAAATLERFVNRPPAILVGRVFHVSSLTPPREWSSARNVRHRESTREGLRFDGQGRDNLARRAETDPRMRSPSDPAEEAAAAVARAGHVNKEPKQLAPTLPARSNAHSGGLRPRAASCGCSRWLRRPCARISASVCQHRGREARRVHAFMRERHM
jgi:hypothetical protein